MAFMDCIACECEALTEICSRRDDGFNEREEVERGIIEATFVAANQ